MGERRLDPRDALAAILLATGWSPSYRSDSLTYAASRGWLTVTGPDAPTVIARVRRVAPRGDHDDERVHLSLLEEEAASPAAPSGDFCPCGARLLRTGTTSRCPDCGAET